MESLAIPGHLCMLQKEVDCEFCVEVYCIFIPTPLQKSGTFQVKTSFAFDLLISMEGRHTVYIVSLVT